MLLVVVGIEAETYGIKIMIVELKSFNKLEKKKGSQKQRSAKLMKHFLPQRFN